MDLYWCEHAWLGGSSITAGVVLSVNDGRFVDVYPSQTVPTGAQRINGVVFPGLANSHSHAFHRALRGRTHRGRGSFWTWRDEMYSVAGRMNPASYLALATATFAEMVVSGYTVVGEFHYLHHGPHGKPYDDPNEMSGVLVEAAATAGIRLTLLDTCYLRGGFDAELNDIQRRYSDGSVEGWIERNESKPLPTGAPVKDGAAIHSVRALTSADMQQVAEWTSRNQLPLHAHVSEQTAENDASLAHTSRTPTQLLADAGVLTSRFCAVHATHLSAGDIELLGSSGASICICATTERDLADGICPSIELVDAGALLTIGSDSHAVIDPFEEARAIETHQRLRTRTRGNHRPDEFLAAASSAGYRCLGWNGGLLAGGCVADLVVIDPSSVRLAGSEVSDVASVAFAATSSDVRDVMVNGEWVVRDRHHRSIDVARALTTSIAAIGLDT